MDDLRSAYKTVRALTQQAGAPFEIPPHLIWRVAAATVGEIVEHVDCDVAPTSSPRHYSGSIVAFTENRVIHATMSDGPSEPRRDEAPTYSGHLHVWRRSDLRSLEIAPDPEDWRNSDREWTNLHSDDHTYPNGFTVTLHYENRDPITLPLPARYQEAARTRAMFEFLPHLLKDLSGKH